MLPLALRALNPQNQLLGGLGLTPEDGLGLTSETLLLTIVPIQGIIYNKIKLHIICLKLIKK